MGPFPVHIPLIPWDLHRRAAAIPALPKAC